MKRKSGLLCLLLTVALSMMALPAMAIRVTGHIYWEGASGVIYFPNPGSSVKLCLNDGTTRAASGQGPNCHRGQVGGFQHLASYYYEVNVPVAGSYWMFTWNDAENWGSSTSITRAMAGSFSITQLNVGPHGPGGPIDMYSAPAPLKPSAIYPGDSAVRTPRSFTLKWTNGLNGDRMSTNWPVTYDIYANGTGAAESLVLSNIPCNPDAAGYCTYPITNLVPAQLYYWRVEAKLNPKLGSPGDPYYKTSSSRFKFTTEGTTHSLMSVLGNFVGADGCGGSNVSAKSASLGSCQTLKLIDHNGGVLESGDQVWIDVYAQPWNFTASNGGGGPLLATSQWGGPYETFTVAKVSGGGTLQDGDQITLQAFFGQYCSAEGGGGGMVNCNRTSVGPWEVFTLGIHP